MWWSIALQNKHGYWTIYGLQSLQQYTAIVQQKTNP